MVLGLVWELPTESFAAQIPHVAVEDPLAVFIADRVVFLGEDQVDAIIVDSEEGRKIHCFDCMETSSTGSALPNRFNFICTHREAKAIAYQ